VSSLELVVLFVQAIAANAMHPTIPTIPTLPKLFEGIIAISLHAGGVGIPHVRSGSRATAIPA
jgi:hypothetical protein